MTSSTSNRFDRYPHCSWDQSVDPDRIEAAIAVLRSFGVKANSASIDLPPHLPLVSRSRIPRCLEDIARDTASRLFAAVEGDTSAWPAAEDGLAYLLTFDAVFEYPQNMPAHMLLWLAGVLCPGHPLSRWWIFAGALRVAKALGSSGQDGDAPWPITGDAMGRALCGFVARYPGRAEAISAAAALEIGRRTDWPSVGDLVTEGTHWDEYTFAEETRLVDSPGELSLPELRKRIGEAFEPALRKAANNPFLQSSMNAPIDEEELSLLRENVFTIRAHMFRRHDFHRAVDWSLYVDGDSEFRVGLNVFSQIGLLARQFHQTGDEAAGRQAIRLWKNWFEQAPAPAVWDNTTWRSLECGVRLSSRWNEIAAMLLEREDFRLLILPDLARWMFLILRYLIAYCGPANNWLQIETAGSLVALAHFPNWPDRPIIEPLLVERLRWINQRMFLPDGMQSECAPGYHVFPWQSETIAMGTLEALGTDVPADAWETLDSAAQPLWKLRLPDGTLPCFSDAGPKLIRADVPMKRYADFCNRPDWLRVLDPGNTDLPEPHTEMQWAGYRVVRTGWGPDDAALAFDGGFYGTNHQHEDKLTFVYHAAGRQLIGDGGICRYSRDAWEHYFRGSWGHNSVTIDGLEQAMVLKYLEGPTEETPFIWPLPDETGGWLTETDRCLLWGCYEDGFSTRKASLWDSTTKHEQDMLAWQKDWKHNRVIAFFGNDGIVVIDTLNGSDSSEHEFEQIFHLAPFVDENDNYVGPGQLQQEKNVFIIPAADQAGVRVSRFGPAAEMRHWCGCEEPVRGYTAIDGEQPSHDVAFAVRGTFPRTMIACIEPIPTNGATRGISLALAGPGLLEIRVGETLHILRYDRMPPEWE